jgi:hypothetical protein
MKRTAVIIVIAGVLAGAAATAQSPAVSFHKDVEPILQKNCQDMPSTRPSRAHVLHDVRERPAVRQGDENSSALAQDAAVVRRLEVRSLPE